MRQSGQASQRERCLPAMGVNFDFFPSSVDIERTVPWPRLHR
jgi:hypothetical protein